MGCNMCVVRAAEEQRRGARQVLRRRPPPPHGDPHTHPGPPPPPTPTHGGGAAPPPGLVDSGTQTDISFESRLGVGPEPPQDYFDPTDPGDPERPEDLEYEEVELYRPSHGDKLGLTVCYRTDGEEDAGIYVGEVNPNSIAAKDGRIREGDRIIQINGVEVQDREEAVAFLTRQQHCSVNLLLARPDCHHWKDSDREDFLDDFGSDEGGDPRRGGEAWTSPGQPPSPGSPSPCHRGGPEPDSGVGRTDESRNDESSEHDLLGDEGGPPTLCRTPPPHGGTPPHRGGRPRTPTVTARPGSCSSSGSASAGRRGPALPGVGFVPPGGRAGADPSPSGVGASSPGRGGAGFAPHTGGGRRGGAAAPVARVGSTLPLGRSGAGSTPSEGKSVAASAPTAARSWAGSTPPTPGASPGRPGSNGKPGAGATLPPHSGTGLLPPSPAKPSADLPAAAVLPGLSAAELRRYRQLRGRLSQQQPPPSSQQRSELALLEEELRHLEFKCRHLLRAHAMERLRQRCLRAWLDAAAAAAPGGSQAANTSPLADIAEERAGGSCGADSTSSTTAYNTSSSPQLHAPGGSGDDALALPLRASRAKRPGRDRLLKARAIKILEERGGSTTDDDARSEFKTGRYWSRQQRRQHLARAREQRRRREMLLQGRGGAAENPPAAGGGHGEQNPLPSAAAAGGGGGSSSRRGVRKRSRRILDNWATIQEMLARGARGGAGGRGDNPLLSVTTV